MKKTTTIPALLNSAPIGGDWMQIAPYGDHPSADRKRVQRFQRPQAEAMVKTFNSWWAQLGNAFRGVPVFHGHPDYDPKNWPDDRRLGKIAEIEAREDGLWGRPEWNDLGAKNAADGYWIYPSPAWLSPETSARIIHPDELLSVGLVNRPNIVGSLPMANAGGIPDETETDYEVMKKEELCALLGLNSATATDEEVKSAAEKMKADAAAKAAAEKKADESTTALDAEKEKVKEANAAKAAAEKKAGDAEAAKTVAVNAAAAVRKQAATVLVNSAITAGKVTEAEKEATVNAFTVAGADFEAEAKKLDEKKAELNSQHLDLGGRKVEINNERARRDAVQVEVNSRMAAQNLTYDAAYQQVKKDPQFKRLFDAMKKPGDEG